MTRNACRHVYDPRDPDAINQGVGLTTEPVFYTFADRLIVEGS
jgi:hypothetical protein